MCVSKTTDLEEVKVDRLAAHGEPAHCLEDEDDRVFVGHCPVERGNDFANTRFNDGAVKGRLVRNLKVVERRDRDVF